MEAKSNRTVEFTGDLLEKPSRPRAAKWLVERLLKNLDPPRLRCGHRWAAGPADVTAGPGSRPVCANPDSASDDRGVLPDRCEPEDKLDKNL
jgi:hypothetical protein